MLFANLRTIVYQQRSKWLPPPLQFDKELGSSTQKGCQGQGSAKHAETVEMMAQHCVLIDTSYCFLPVCWEVLQWTLSKEKANQNPPSDIDVNSIYSED